MKHDVKILELTSDATSIAVVDPGIVFVDPGDTIDFWNQTKNPARLTISADHVLVDVPSMVPKPIAVGGPTTFTVEPRPPVGTHEYVLAVTLSNDRQVFAIGASTPKIIIRSMTEVVKS